MNFTKRSIKKYSFKSPDLSRLRELGSKVTDQVGFRNRHGNLLSILKIDVEEGILETLVQFYDPMYHCFTFPDYQLVPTLEEYSYWIGLPISDKEPFNGLEPPPKNETIAAALHLKKSDIDTNLIFKGGFQGLTSKFLYQKAFTFVKTKRVDAFEPILALLIYGLLLFPNVNGFVDLNAIQIFLTKNPVPTLLGDTYHSIHHRTEKEYGVITCCAPLLYRWYTSHLPQFTFSKTNSGKANWSQRIMPLTPNDIIWYQPACDIGVIIDSCGEFPNVPLIGTRGGITYNPTLARRQLGYPMKEKPNNLSLTGEFYLNLEDHANLRGKFVRAWHAVRRLDRNQLGKKLNFAHGSYTQWVIDRAMNFGLPYHLPRNLSSTIPSLSLPIPFESKAEFQDLLDEVRRERDAWEKRCHAAELENETLKGKIEQQEQQIFTQSQQLVEKSDIIQRQEAMLRRDSGRKRKQMEFFSQSIDPDDPDAN